MIRSGAALRKLLQQRGSSAFATATAAANTWSSSTTTATSRSVVSSWAHHPQTAAAVATTRTIASASPSGTYDQTIQEPFPSLIIGSKVSDGITAVGSFAEAQAMYLDPDPEAVDALVKLLEETNMGIVAHYYMDVELQGVLQAANAKLPGRIGIADSLKMGDMAVDMCNEFGCKAIACLGVDFMSESVSAILSKNGYGHVPVYRAAQAKIGCSLAESAEREAYRAWLQKESASGNALHVVYINTSLETKAVSNSIVPTITCTSSNVLQTLLTASAQMGDQNLKILYGPDTYMGDNLVTLFDTVLGTYTGVENGWDDAKIASDLHPQHNRASLQRLRDSIAVFPSGNCVVHHMFGESVVDTVKESYQDSYVTAHLEVPGEMFQIAMEKSLTDNGVVGSTSDILNFISRKVQETANSNTKDVPTRLSFILGTEAGMVTSIVQSVQRILQDTGKQHLQAEIVFPVASDAVTPTEDGSGLVPGVTGGEGCSTAGGCATCPFMKMNDLDALLDVLEMNKTGTASAKLAKHLPPNNLKGKQINGRDAIEVGSEPIVYMRHFNQHKELPEDLVKRVLRQQ